jgi:hypothetical protein
VGGAVKRKWEELCGKDADLRHVRVCLFTSVEQVEICDLFVVVLLELMLRCGGCPVGAMERRA